MNRRFVVQINLYNFRIAITYCSLEFLGVMAETPKTSYIFHIGQFTVLTICYNGRTDFLVTFIK